MRENIIFCLIHSAMSYVMVGEGSHIPCEVVSTKTRISLHGTSCLIKSTLYCLIDCYRVLVSSIGHFIHRGQPKVPGAARPYRRSLEKMPRLLERTQRPSGVAYVRSSFLMECVGLNGN